MTQQDEKKRPYGVFIINEFTTKDGETRAQWLRIGAGFQNGDGSFNLLLRALPLPDPKTGAARLHMRLPKPETDEQDDDSFYLEIDPIMGAPMEAL